MSVKCPECFKEYPNVSENAIAVQWHGGCVVCREMQLKPNDLTAISAEAQRRQVKRTEAATKKNRGEDEAYAEAEARAAEKKAPEPPKGETDAFGDVQCPTCGGFCEPVNIVSCQACGKAVCIVCRYQDNGPVACSRECAINLEDQQDPMLMVVSRLDRIAEALEMFCINVRFESDDNYVTLESRFKQYQQKILNLQDTVVSDPPPDDAGTLL